MLTLNIHKHKIALFTYILSTKIIVLQEVEVANILPHGDLLYSALVQGKLLGHIYVTFLNNQKHRW